jgi:hypothetical protein
VGVKTAFFLVVIRSWAPLKMARVANTPLLTTLSLARSRPDYYRHGAWQGRQSVYNIYHMMIYISSEVYHAS